MKCAFCFQFEWPEVEKGGDVRQTKMVYKFDYLPAGLFNRGQVCVHFFWLPF
jgi:hypothetical protein